MSRSSKNIQPNWRPNFRNPETLPDIKAVRTDFIVNFVAVALAFLAVIFVGQREYRAHVLKSSIRDLERQIRVAEPDDAATLKLSQRYREGADNFVELERFYRSAFFVHDMLGELARNQPVDLIFDSISYSEAVSKRDQQPVVEYRVVLSGKVKELPVLDGFKATLGETPSFGNERFSVEIDETVQSRDTETRIFPYQINITLRPADLPDAETDDGEAES